MCICAFVYMYACIVFSVNVVCHAVGFIAQRGCVRQHVCMMTAVCVGSVESGVISGDRRGDSSGCLFRKVKKHYV